jgi:hypothetical protein
MHKPILESLAEYLADQSGPGLGAMRIILPNRRAGLFLQRHLSTHIQEVQWAPRIYAISEFIDESSELNQSDPVELLFELYDIYREQVEIPDTLDEFYFWGEIMLRDFDELDKYLVDAGLLFRNIMDLKMLEEPLAGLDPDRSNLSGNSGLDFTRGITRLRKKSSWISGNCFHGCMKD